LVTLFVRAPRHESRPLVPRAAAFLFLFLFLVPALASAQAWLPFRGEGYLSLIGQHIRLSGHFDTDGSRLEKCAPSSAWVSIADFEYGLTDRLAFSARLPYVASRYTGSAEEPCTAELRQLHHDFQSQSPNAALTSLDTGSYYATFQDLGFSLRYSLFDRGVAVTPVIGVTIPSHDYRTVGEAAPGQNRLALHAGINIGRLLEPSIPGAYVHARYTYSFVQSLLDVSLNRSDAEFEIGYAIRPTVIVRGLAAWQQTHGGLAYIDAIERASGANGQPGNPEIYLDHDRLLATRYWHIGGGGTVKLTEVVDLNGAVLTFVSGADSHYGVGATLGVTWKVSSAKRQSP
jgi:hypothetical protein